MSIEITMNTEWNEDNLVNIAVISDVIGDKLKLIFLQAYYSNILNFYVVRFV